jgi:hypothetical protein
MRKAKSKLIEAVDEMVQIAKGEIPAARIYYNGHAYVPESAPPVSGWQTMKTCPLREYVLLWLDGFPAIGYQFEEGKFCEHHSRPRNEMFHVTHWAPLPPPPEPTDEGRGGR